jgi:two-component system LytT family sensor kinase
VRRPRRIAPSKRFSPIDLKLPFAYKTWRIWLVSFGLWGFIACAGAVSITEYYRSMGKPMKFTDILALECSAILPYALLTPLVFTLAARYPVRRENWIRRSMLHLAAGLVFSALHVGMRGLTPYAAWDAKTESWHSAMWDSQAHRFRIRWRVLQSLFLSNVVDDISGAYVPIVLVADVISFYEKAREREQRTSQLEAQLAKANLQALKSRLQPHFLFNTMHSISALMLTDVHAADKMMTRLSDLLRMNLENDREQITHLSRELELVNGYLEIEKIRFGDRLNVVLDIADDTLDAQVPHLLLQPLVENAVRHGIAQLATKGEVRLVSRHEGDTLQLAVMDNGPGFESFDTSYSKSGLGLRATQERLQTLYGENQYLNVRTLAGGGVEVSVRIPFHEANLTD